MVLCRMYASGSCRYGASCKFEHPSPSGGALHSSAPSSSTSSTVCEHFRRGRCRFGDTCKFSHALTVENTVLSSLRTCSHFVGSGACSFGAKCRYIHPGEPGVQGTEAELALACLIVEDTGAGEKPAWPLTAYGRPGLGSYVGGEFSPEELRAAFYARARVGESGGVLADERMAVAAKKTEFDELGRKCQGVIGTQAENVTAAMKTGDGTAGRSAGGGGMANADPFAASSQPNGSRDFGDSWPLSDGPTPTRTAGSAFGAFGRT